jgi:outer membrane lipoprotein SlyB
MLNILNITRHPAGLAALLLAMAGGLSACDRSTGNESTEDALLTETTTTTTTTVTPAPEPVVSNPEPVRAAAVASPPPCSNCGVITEIRKKEVEGKATGGGAVAGAIIGGLITREAVKGDHRNEAAAAGAIAGGVAGHQIEQEVRATHYYVFFVRMDKDDRIVKIKSNSKGDLLVGDKVRVTSDGIISRR